MLLIRRVIIATLSLITQISFTFTQDVTMVCVFSEMRYLITI